MLSISIRLMRLSCYKSLWGKVTTLSLTTWSTCLNTYLPELTGYGFKVFLRSFGRESQSSIIIQFRCRYCFDCSFDVNLIFNPFQRHFVPSGFGIDEFEPRIGCHYALLFEEMDELNETRLWGRMFAWVAKARPI